MIARQCVMLVGGMGTRLGELTRNIPKPLLPVSGVPFIEILLREAARRGFDDFLLLAGYHAQEVAAYLEQSRIAETLRVAINISVEGTPLGTAGALAHAASQLDESFLLLNGDTWFDFNWLDFAQRATAAGISAAVALRRIDRPIRFETVLLEGRVVRAWRQRDENAKSGLINGGVYWLRKDVIRQHLGPRSLETQVLPELCADGALAGWVYDGFFVDIGVPEAYEAAQTAIPARRRRQAAFLDRDGVLNVDTDYVHLWSEFVWIDGAKAAVKKLNDLGYYVFLATNQAGIAHGYYDEEDLLALHRCVLAALREEGAAIDDWRFCAHHPAGKLAQYRGMHPWRKPAPGMINDLVASWPVALEGSFLVGDKDSDLEAARAAGIQGHLFQGGNLLDFIGTIVAKAPPNLPVEATPL